MLMVMFVLFMVAIVKGRLMCGLVSASLNRFIEFFSNVPGAVVPGTKAPDILAAPQRVVED